MKLVPTKVGADPKKLAILGGLVVVLGAVYVINRDPGAPQAAGPTAAPNITAPRPLPQRAPVSRDVTPQPSGTASPFSSGAGRRGEATLQDFKPTLKLPEGADVSRIDPSLKLDLLAKLQQAGFEGGGRSLFEFGAAPAKPAAAPTPTVAPVKPEPLSPAPPVTPAPPPKPVVPPIPLKFYGYVSEAQGPRKRAFFLDGDDIVVAGENDTIRNRYKVIRIGVNSAVVEDMTTKNEQTLPLVEELQG